MCLHSPSFIVVSSRQHLRRNIYLANTFYHLALITSYDDRMLFQHIATGDEWRKEFCFEGFRMWDLQRWKLGVNRTDVFSGSPAVLPYPSDKAIAPIPRQDVNLGGIPQNPSY